MSITAKNYAAQAQRGLKEFAEAIKKNQDIADDANNILEFAEAIGESVHFALPDYGSLFDDKLKGLAGSELHLPYPEITVEYHVPPTDYGDEKLVNSPKRLVYAKEIDFTLPEMQQRFPGFDVKIKSAILVYAANEIDGKWFPVFGGCLVPTRWDDYTNGVVEDPLSTSWRSDRSANFVAEIIELCPCIIDQQTKHSPGVNLRQHLLHDIGSEAAAILELCEALTCSNVKAEVIEKIDLAKNARRIKKGKLPLYETKILTIEVPKSNSGSATGKGNSERQSPRQHLRRGHIRHLANGSKIWVSACSVGDRSLGFIDKKYATRVSD